LAGSPAGRISDPKGTKPGKREEAEAVGLNIEDLCRRYIGAGLDPARFWDLTPRLLVTELEGAEERRVYERSILWTLHNMPRLKEPPTFEQFVRGKKDRAAEVQRFHAAWDKIDRALARSKVKRQT
jgi:hypothetical protein